MKRFLITTSALAFMSASSMAACSTPKYIAHDRYDPGARVVSAVVFPFAALMSLALQPLRLIGDKDVSDSVKKSQCAPRSMLKHTLGE